MRYLTLIALFLSACSTTSSNSNLNQELDQTEDKLSRLVRESNRLNPQPQAQPERAQARNPRDLFRDRPAQRTTRRVTRRAKRSTRRVTRRTARRANPGGSTRTVRMSIRRPAQQLPCYLDKPRHVAEGDMVLITNNMQHAIGMRVNGKQLTVVGSQLFNGRMLPGGIGTAFGLLPRYQKCWHPVERPGSGIRIDAVMYRRNPYRETEFQALSKMTRSFDFRYPRTDEMPVRFDRFSWGRN